MKLLVLAALCFFSVGAIAQLPNDRNYQKRDTIEYFKGNNPDILRQQQEYWQKGNAQNNLLANKRGNVVILPQDKMPCIVPDTTGISKMPNAWGATTLPYTPQFHPIPNPALPKPQSFGLKIPDNGLQSQGK